MGNEFWQRAGMSSGRIHVRWRPWLSQGLALMVGSVVVLAMGPAASAQQKRTRSGELEWKVLQGCTLLTNKLYDGDSFHVMCRNEEYNFRLYFVDAPETDASFPDQVARQAEYFEIAAADVLRAGQMAKEFTRRWLESGRFTALTRYDNARGLGSLPRVYAVVLMGKNNLAEALVTHGWACIRGRPANWPGGPGSAKFISELEKLEAEAREQKRGVWNDRVFKRVATAAKAPTAKPAARAAGGRIDLIDLNTASKKELDELPGIGSVLADRIIAGRPYRTVNDLETVPGIGPKTMEKLRPRVTVSTR